MLAMARERCAAAKLDNVELVEGTFEIDEVPGGPVDAAVGRRVLIATAEEIDVDTLDARLQQERRETKATITWEMVYCGWARTQRRASDARA